VKVKVTVKYFASLRETMGCAEQQVEIEEKATLADIWQQVNSAQGAERKLLCALNMEYVDWDTVVAAGDEVAFFPPVTGG